MRNGRPTSCTSTSPCARIASTLSLNRLTTWAGSIGAAMVTSARASAIFGAAASTAAPPRLWPMRIAGGAIARAQMIGGGDQILDVRGEMRVGEFALAHPESGEIEAHHRDAGLGQPLGDALGGEVVLAAGEAMRKQRVGDGLAQRQVDQGRELLASAVGKIETLGAHGLPRFSGAGVARPSACLLVTLPLSYTHPTWSPVHEPCRYAVRSDFSGLERPADRDHQAFRQRPGAQACAGRTAL